MSQKLIEAVARTTRLQVVNLLKRSQGMAVRDIADALRMSYMGARDSVRELERRGLVESWREPRGEGSAGRPRRLLRLTEKAHALFPKASNPLTIELLDAAKKLHGPSAPEKLLLLAWQQKAARLVEHTGDGPLGERVQRLAAARDADGHMAVVEGRGSGLRIVERHCPFLDVLREYPIVARLDTELIRRVLNAPVRREESCAGGLLRVDYVIEYGE